MHMSLIMSFLNPETGEAAPPQSPLKSREQIAVADRWNVEALYASPEAWQAELLQVQGASPSPRWPSIAAFQGTLADPTRLSHCLDALFQLDRSLMKLHTYAHLRFDEDLGNNGFKKDYGLINSLCNEFQVETSWIEPELLSLDTATFNTLLSAPQLKPYRFYLEKIFRRKPHTLSKAQEELLALSGQPLSVAADAFRSFNNADLKFPPVKDSLGREHPLSNGTFLSLVQSTDRTLRRNAYLRLHQRYGDYVNTFCELLGGHVQAHLFNAKARKFPSCLDAALFGNQISTEVYRKLIQAVRARLSSVHDYIAFRKKALKLDEIHPYDLYVPLFPESTRETPYSVAREQVVASVAPLGAEYQAALRQGLLEDRWVDVYENPRKRSGAYSSGCYDSMPYILLNYHGQLKDVLTLAHEAGHSMHSYLSRKHQSYVYADYPIFVAEVASTFNEQLLLEYLRSKTTSQAEQAALINYELEQIRGTIVRQTLFAEFELKIHEWAEQRVPLTPDLLNRTFLELNRDYYGPELVLDLETGYEWARIPHFYYNFYVYQYATGLSASLSLFQTVKKQGNKKYLQFLSSGGSGYPLDLLRSAGVDMTTDAPINAAFDRFDALLAELKKLIAK
jgi:oligoendopeptidase F